MYAFDNPLPPADLAQIRSEGQPWAVVMGAPAAAPAAASTQDAKWRIADPAIEAFGDEVQDDVLADPNACVLKDTKGLCEIDPFGWTLIARRLFL